MTASATDRAFSVDANEPLGDAPPRDVAPSTDAPRRRRRTHLWVLLALTVLAGALRFVWLDRPTLWGDEAMTFSRVTGTFQDFLDIHQRDAFTPLHYELYWLLGKLVLLTPFWMRLIPAVAGTLMVPAMYFLARQMVGVRTALVAAGLTATSAYLLGYSRDAKMYMAFWLCCTLNVGSFLWWLRTGRRVAWLAWVAAGATMLALHLTGLFVLGVQVLFVLTRRRVVRERPSSEGTPELVERPRWRRVLAAEAAVWALFIVGLVVITAGAAGHFLGFQLWSEPLTERVGKDVPDRPPRGVWPRVENEDLTIPGIEWVPQFNRGRDGGSRLLQLTTAFLFSHEWPRADVRPRIAPRVQTAMAAAAWTLLGLFVLGSLPWPARRRGARGDDPPTEPWWRAATWVALWLVVPTYVVYCASVDEYAAPWDWVTGIAQLPYAAPVAGVLLGLGAVAVALHWFGGSTGAGRAQYDEPDDPAPAPRQETAATDARALLDYAGPPPEEMQRRRRWARRLAISRAVLRQRAARLLQLLGAVAFVLLVCAAIYWTFHALGREPRDKWVPRYLGVIWPAVGIAMAALLMRIPTWPLRWLAVAFVVAVNLGQFGFRVFGDVEPRVDLLTRDVWAAQDPAGELRTYVRRMPGGLGPAGGGLQNFVGKYYLSIAMGRHLTPWTLRLFPLEAHARVGYVFTAAQVTSDIQRAPHVRRIVTWESIGKEYADAPSTLLAQLGPEWRIARTDVFHVYDHWTWAHQQTQRRREYERLPPAPATQPATPATRPAAPGR